MNKTQAKLLLKLCDYLEEKVPPSKFDMNRWMVPNVDYEELEEVYLIKGGNDEDVMPRQCKTRGCALGWAATIPTFRRKGLKLECRGDEHLTVVLTTEDGKKYTDFDAGAMLFGLEDDEATKLFSEPRPHNRSEKPAQTAKRFRKFVKGHFKELVP